MFALLRSICSQLLYNSSIYINSSFADFSHFELVIERLQEQAAQEAMSDREDSVCPTGNDEEQPEEGLNINVCTVSCSFSSRLNSRVVVLVCFALFDAETSVWEGVLPPRIFITNIIYTQ